MKFDKAIENVSTPTAFAAAGVVAALDEAGVLLDPDGWKRHETPNPADPVLFCTVVSPLGLASGHQALAIGKGGDDIWRAVILALWSDRQGVQREHCCLEAVGETPAELVSTIRRIFEETKRPD